MISTTHPINLAELRVLSRARPHGVVALGAIIDPTLGGGLARGALHEIAADGLEAEIGALAAGFITSLISLIPSLAPVVWIARIPDLYPPGLRIYGFDPGRLILAHAPNDQAVLAGMEIALRAGSAAAVVGEVGKLGRLSSRRLQLACRKRGCTGFLLRRFPHGRNIEGYESSATTRWRIASSPSLPDHGAPGLPRWHVRLLTARGGTEGQWRVEAAGDTNAPFPFRVLPELADPAPTAARRRAS